MSTNVANEEKRHPVNMPSTLTAGRVTLRAIIIALILSVINDYWIVQLEVVRYSFATYAAPFYNVIFTLFVVTLANFGIKRLIPRYALTRIELITIYSMVSISSAVCSHNMMEILVSMMGFAHFWKDDINKWGELFADERLPRWLTVSDHESLRHFYYGNSTLYNPDNYMPWIVPALCWSAFCAVLLFTTLCISSILRKQWIESEKLTFPVIQLPLEMTDESGSLFKNRVMWMGFAISGILTLIAGIHYLYPSVPYLRIVRQDIGRYITNPPWNAIGGISLGFYFWAIGIAFLMPLELSFSTWFFYWLSRLELVACRVLGLNEVVVTGGGFDRTYPFLNSQSYGAYLAFFLMSIWAAKGYLKRIFRTAFMGTNEEDESREAMSYRAAILGALAGLMLLAVFAHLIGMSWWVIILFFILYFIFVVLINRIRAELGFPIHDMHNMSPQHPIMTALGTENIPRQDLVGFSLFFWFNRTYASHPAPHQLEAFKLAERNNTPARQIFVAILIAGIFAMPIGFWMLLHIYYQYGAATARMEMWAMEMGRSCWSNLAGWITQPFPPNPTALQFVGVGFVVSMLLGWARMNIIGFPLHPLAYAISNSWGVHQIWAPILIGWAAKTIVLKFGGLRFYRRALPFFFGLILGEIVVGSLWTIVGIVLGIPTYDFWPGKYN